MSDDAPSPDESGGNYEVDFLVEQYLTGRLNSEEAGRLLALLQAQPELGLRLLNQLHIDVMLRRISRADTERMLASLHARAGGSVTVTPPVVRRRSWWPATRFGRLAAMAACIGLGVLVGAGIWSKWQAVKDHGAGGGPGPLAVEESTTTTVAVLACTVDAVWETAAAAHEAGSPLEPGWLRLKSGLVEVEFYSGARVVLEGPGQLQLQSATEAYCPAGRLSAEVPLPAHGFRIGTPRGEVIDFGTAFGLDVTGAGDEVHVFKGEVELHRGAQAKQGLKEGEAAAVGGDGKLRLFAADASAFTSPAVLERKAADALGRKFTAWKAAADTLNADPALVVRLDFEGLQSGDRTLPNRAAVAAAAPATIIGCARADGRWVGKGALEFKGISDRVRLEVPGELESVSFVAWVRVNGLDRRFNSLFMSDGFSPGATHWQILKDGRVRLGIGVVARPSYSDYDSPVVFTPERLGQWVHLAVVYDAAAKQVTHYVDGKPVKPLPIRWTNPLHIGPAELGNWTPGPRADSTPIRHFSGRMDELAVYRRALSAAEILQAYTIGSGTN